MSIARLRLVAINDAYELTNLPKLKTFLNKLSPAPSAVLLAGDFLSPSTLSSIDGGRGMVTTLRATGITHCCFGNHEADLTLSSLKDRITELSKSVTVVNTNMRNPPTNAAWLQSPLTPPYSIIATPCERVKVALLGFISDEDNMFRDGTFQGIPIDNVLSTFSSMYQALHERVDFFVPMTHQSIDRDRDLAQHMLEMDIGRGVIIGGHDHYPIDETVTDPIKPDDSIRILKTGCQARQASLVDLDFDVSTAQPQLAKISASFVDLTTFDDAVAVKNIVETQMSVVEKLEHEIIVDESMLPPGTILSSERSCSSETTVGAFFCQAIKEELEVDVAVINGGSLWGDTTYEDSTMSYYQLKKELPFPTKMVVVPMTRGELQNAVDYSRTYIEEKGLLSSDKDIPRRAYLQVDFAFGLDPYSGDQDEVLQVAVPRNLLGGFCKIQPLMDLKARLKEQNRLPSEDDYLPALDLVTRFCCKTRWVGMILDTFAFDEFDLDHDGVLDRSEVKRMMEKILGREPEDFVVDDMISSVDADGDGTIDMGEFSHLLATMEREYWRKF